MRKFLLSIVTIAGVLAVILGHVVNNRVGQKPDIKLVVWSESVGKFSQLWVNEVARRYDRAVVVCVHGGTFDGRWYMQPDDVTFDGMTVEARPIPVEEGIAKLQRIYPGYRIVLVCCNPGHLALRVPGVTYALDSVWFMPDDPRFPTAYEDRLEPLIVGDIFEFIEN